MSYFAIITLIYNSIILQITRSHYTIDIFAAIIIAHLIFLLTNEIYLRQFKNEYLKNIEYKSISDQIDNIWFIKLILKTI